VRKPRRPSDSNDLRELGRLWLDKIKAAEKDEKSWLDDAKKATEAYTGEDSDDASDESLGDYDFNILFSNVETIVPAVINSPPAPDIRRRFGEADPAARTVAEVVERVIRLQVDDSSLQVELESSAQDAFLAGRGVVRLRFRSDIVGQGEPTNDDIADAAEVQDGGHEGVEEGMPLLSVEPGAGAGMATMAGAETGAQPLASALGHNGGPPLETVTNERITFESVSWVDYRHGPAKRWDDRPWDAFRFCIPREDEGTSFDANLIASQLSAVETNKRSGVSDLIGWEIWDKKKREVIFIDEEGVVLKRIQDPLGLSQFFCIATPLQPIEINGRLKPVNPFKVYKKLADDLEVAVRRKTRLIEAMKVKGWYGTTQKDITAVLDLNDNEFAPIADAEIWAANGGLANAVAFWPFEKFIAAIQVLDGAIAQYKAWIYEVTGISDIVRGASVASETATAQNIKSQWGSLRIQKMQRMMERCARQLFVMMSEIIPTKFTQKTLEEMTAIPLIPTPQDPAEVVQQKLAVAQLMQQRLASYYRIDVESDSTVRADLTRQKQEVSEFLQGAAAYFQSVGPLVQQGTMPAEAAVEIFASNARMFNLGKSVEDTLEGMVNLAKQKAAEAQSAPKDQEPNPEQIAAQQKSEAEKQKFQLDMAKSTRDAEQSQQEFQQRMAEAVRKAQDDGAAAQRKAILDELTMELKRLEIQAKKIEVSGKAIDAETQAAESARRAIEGAMQPTETIIMETAQ
jgi:hypothetical protein